MGEWGGGGLESHRPHKTRPHMPEDDELGVKGNTDGAKEIRDGLFLTFPTCGIVLLLFTCYQLLT